MNFLKNQLCGDVCGIINNYLMIEKKTVNENKKLVIKQLKMLIDFQEADKKYYEGFKKANKQEREKIIKFFECVGNKYMSSYCNNLNVEKGIYPFHHIKEVNDFYKKKMKLIKKEFTEIGLKRGIEIYAKKNGLKLSVNSY